MGERVRDEPVCKPGISRQERPVEVGSDRPPDPAPFEPRLAVVPESEDDPAQRLGPRLEDRSPSMVLETSELVPISRLELAVEENVSDHAGGAGDRLVGEKAHAGQEGSVTASIPATEQLVAAADREQRRSARDYIPNVVAFRGQIRCNQSLLAVLATTDVQEIVRAGPNEIVEPDRLDLELVTAERRSP
jgi:hypothetical protein